MPARFFQSKDNLRIFSKVVSFSTWILIFAGGLVTSTGSGLSVPDWPLSYGTLFPPMVGGIRFEHTHRMIASIVGLLMLILTVWLGLTEKRRWVKNLAFFALGTVIAQGILGGMTVLFFLPKPISISHGVLAQTFFVLTILIAYSQSLDRNRREIAHNFKFDKNLARIGLVTAGLIYAQLILGALMRHTHSGLAIPDFPRMGGTFFPSFDPSMLAWINHWRFTHNLEPVAMSQIVIHFAHRLTAFCIAAAVIVYFFYGKKSAAQNTGLQKLLAGLLALIVLQITLGALTILTLKEPLTTTCHVAVGAATLGVSVLCLLQIFPTSWKSLKNG